MKLRLKRRKVEDLLAEILERIESIQMATCGHEEVYRNGELAKGQFVAECYNCGRVWVGEKAELCGRFGKRLRW